jgi:hypothetical protein
VLAWYVVFLGVLALTPVVQPQSFALVCASGSLQWQDIGDDGAPAAAVAPDCALCCAATAPPPAVAAVPTPSRLRHACLPQPAAHIAALTAAPLPARGPPTLA